MRSLCVDTDPVACAVSDCVPDAAPASQVPPCGSPTRLHTMVTADLKQSAVPSCISRGLFACSQKAQASGERGGGRAGRRTGRRAGG